MLEGVEQSFLVSATKDKKACSSEELYMRRLFCREAFLSGGFSVRGLFCSGAKKSLGNKYKRVTSE